MRALFVRLARRMRHSLALEPSIRLRRLHIALAPVYYQNYLLGELVASQLQAALVGRCGGIVDRPEAGDFLRRDVFAPGWSLRWDELISTATGAPLSVDAFAAELHRLDRE